MKFLIVFNGFLARLRALLPGIALTVSLLSANSAFACHGRPHGNRPPPPVCNIPDNRYDLSGVLEGDEHISLTLWIKQRRPILIIKDNQQKTEYLATVQFRDRPPRHHGHGGSGHKCKKGKHKGFKHRPPSANAIPGHPLPHKHHPNPFMARNCKDKTITLQWEPSMSVPAGIEGEASFQFGNNALSGSIRMTGKNIDVNDNSVTLIPAR